MSFGYKSASLIPLFWWGNRERTIQSFNLVFSESLTCPFMACGKRERLYFNELYLKKTKLVTSLHWAKQIRSVLILKFKEYFLELERKIQIKAYIKYSNKGVIKILITEKLNTILRKPCLKFTSIIYVFQYIFINLYIAWY